MLPLIERAPLSIEYFRAGSSSPGSGDPLWWPRDPDAVLVGTRSEAILNPPDEQGVRAR